MYSIKRQGNRFNLDYFIYKSDIMVNFQFKSYDQANDFSLT